MTGYRSWRKVIVYAVSAFWPSTALFAQERPAEPSGLHLVAAMEETLAQAIARSEKSVVSIARVSENVSAENEYKPDAFGNQRSQEPKPGDPDFIPSAFATGVVIGHGLVLTTEHVLALKEGKSKFYVTSAGRKTYEAWIKGTSPRMDLAVLEVREKAAEEDFVPINFGDGSKLRKGQIVIALGNPHAIARDGQASASWGIVANLQRKAAPLPAEPPASARGTLHHFGTLIQTDAKLNLGTSGGALVNLRGEMIGLTTALAAVAGFEQAAGYAIPVDDTFRDTVDRLKEGREKESGLLGVEPERGLSIQGAVVHEARIGGPAQAAGIGRGDVIVQVDDESIRDEDDLMLHIGRRNPGDVARIVIERGGRRMAKEVVLAKFPIQVPMIVTNPESAWRGLSIDYPTALWDYQWRARMGEVPSEPCVIVRDVAEGSPAWEAGLRRGMLIGRVAKVRVDSPGKFRDLVANQSGDVSLQLVTSTGKPTTITVPPKP
ncbi:MAG: trypsin-like peptidase domain-containing protein [Planctomycetia bacterium]|nr:trypsin-like peptidase domain-containing protein [Planctomycetia bacterium]